MRTLIAPAPLAMIDTTDLFGFSVGARIGNNVRATLFCRNCTNRHVPTSIGTESGDAAARTNTGAPVPKLSYLQSFNLDSVRSIGASLRFSF
jgi:iron complex outermembrane receptor protein